MNAPFNPYAAPQAPTVTPASDVPLGAPQPWTVGEVLELARGRLTANWVVLVLSYFLTTVIVEALAMTPTVLMLTGVVDRHGPAEVVIRTPFFIAQALASAYFQVGTIRIWLEVARGGTPSFSLLFTGFDRMFPYLVCAAFSAAAIIVGFVLFIVPGVILAVGLSLGHFYVVGAKMSPVQALRASWTMTRGHRGHLFMLMVAGAGLAILGALMCGFGIFVMVPWACVASAIAFMRISGWGMDPRGAQPAQAAFPAGPPPGYGPPGPPGYGPPGYGPSR